MIICVGGEKGELVMCIDGRWRGDVCKWVLRGDVEWQYKLAVGSRPPPSSARLKAGTDSS